MTTNCLIIMARAPVVGRVKTRLIPALGRGKACRVYRLLLRENARTLRGGAAWRTYLFCAPHARAAFFARLRLRFGIALKNQAAGDLGGKMRACMAFACRYYAQAIIVGADVENVTAATVRRAFAALADGADLVLGVNADGGYGLIGLNQNHAGLFRGMPWGTAKVAALTRQRARRAGLRTVVIDGVRDVDVYRDYRRWLKDRGRRRMLYTGGGMR